MSQIRADRLTFSYDGSIEPVFENASFTLDTDWKLGLIGRNGKGKQHFSDCLQVSFREAELLQSPSLLPIFRIW